MTDQEPDKSTAMGRMTDPLSKSLLASSLPSLNLTDQRNEPAFTTSSMPTSRPFALSSSRNSSKHSAADLLPVCDVFQFDLSQANVISSRVSVRPAVLS